MAGTVPPFSKIAIKMGIIVQKDDKDSAKDQVIDMQGDYVKDKRMALAAQIKEGLKINANSFIKGVNLGLTVKSGRIVYISQSDPDLYKDKVEGKYTKDTDTNLPDVLIKSDKIQAAEMLDYNKKGCAIFLMDLEEPKLDLFGGNIGFKYFTLVFASNEKSNETPKS